MQKKIKKNDTKIFKNFKSKYALRKLHLRYKVMKIEYKSNKNLFTMISSDYV